MEQKGGNSIYQIHSEEEVVHFSRGFKLAQLVPTNNICYARTTKKKRRSKTIAHLFVVRSRRTVNEIPKKLSSWQNIIIWFTSFLGPWIAERFYSHRERRIWPMNRCVSPTPTRLPLPQRGRWHTDQEREIFRYRLELVRENASSTMQRGSSGGRAARNPDSLFRLWRDPLPNAWFKPTARILYS